mmetsp:Transcript_29397/g.44243  ORF Transcript_29397/g.44243 Transcript_29397/m.44243 type:complete len:114 (+) Transcript_29397:430-771(+)
MNLEFKHIAIASSQVIYLKTNHFSHAHAERRKAPPTNMDIPVTMVEIILIRPEEEPSGAVTDASLSLSVVKAFAGTVAPPSSSAGAPSSSAGAPPSSSAGATPFSSAGAPPPP